MTESPLTEMVRVMLERDVERDVILLALATAERHASSRDASRSQRDGREKSAERSRRYRAKRHGDASRDGVTQAPILSSSNLSSVSQEPPKEENKKEKKVRARNSQNVTLRDDWQPNEGHFAAAEKRKISPAGVGEIVEDMRFWAKSKGITRKDWDATFHGFIRRDVKYGAMNERAQQTRNYPASRPAQTHEAAILAGVANYAKKRGLIQSSARERPFSGCDDAPVAFDADYGTSGGDPALPIEFALVACADGRKS